MLRKKLSEGMNVLLDIEVQGALQVHQKMPEAVMVFIIPPSMAELEKRLRSRGTDSSARSRLALSALKRNMPQRTFMTIS